MDVLGRNRKQERVVKARGFERERLKERKLAKSRKTYIKEYISNNYIEKLCM